MAQAIDFKAHWLRRQSRKLAKQVAEYATSGVAWEIAPGIRMFMTDHGLQLPDLQHVLETCTKAIPGSNSNELAIFGVTCDDVYTMIMVRICTCEHDERRHLELIGGKLFPDEEDLVS